MSGISLDLDNEGNVYYSFKNRKEEGVRMYNTVTDEISEKLITEKIGDIRRTQSGTVYLCAKNKKKLIALNEGDDIWV